MTQHDEGHKKHGAWGAALLAGMAAGLAAGMFLGTDKGHEMTEDAKKQAKLLQKQLAKKMKNLKELSKDKYADLVDDVIAQYQHGKKLADAQVHELKMRLLDQWDNVREQMEDDEDEA